MPKKYVIITMSIKLCLQHFFGGISNTYSSMGKPAERQGRKA